jgi:hypothetical protein
LPLFSQRQWLFYNIKSVSSIPFLIFSKEIYKKVPKAAYSIHNKPLSKPLLTKLRVKSGIYKNSGFATIRNFPTISILNLIKNILSIL